MGWEAPWIAHFQRSLHFLYSGRVMPVHRRCTQWPPPPLHSTEVWLLSLIVFLQMSHVQTVFVGPGLDSTSPLWSSSSASHMTGSMGWFTEKISAVGPPFREARVWCVDLALRVEGSPRRRRRQRIRGDAPAH